MLNDICSVIVTYNFDDDFRKNIEKIHKQSLVIWIDNSTNSNIQALRDDILQEYPDVVYIQNEVNIGLSKSYNIALDLAKVKNAKYFVTFDQDTLIDDDTLERLIALMEKYHLDSIGPNFRNHKRLREEMKQVKFLISSCNITKMSVYETINYDERYFIDDVDLDFCFAMKKNNYKYAQANDVHIAHKIGEKYVGRFGIAFYAHKPLRYYYIFRNYYYLRKKYSEKYLYKLGIRLVIVKILICLFFKDKDKKEALYFANKGILEGRQE